MNPALGLAMFPLLLILIMSGIPVAFSLLITSATIGYFVFGTSLFHMMTSKLDVIVSDGLLAAIPLFIFMGAMLQHSGIAERLFRVVYDWLEWLPGSLAVTAIVVGTIFACAAGVVGATETVIGLLLVPAMLKHGYNKPLLSGTICAGGSLGTVIPPSITVIVLGPIANVSVGELFAGLLFPGLMMAGLFLVYIVVACLIWPDLAPRSRPQAGAKRPLGERLKDTAFALLPTGILIFLVLGSILLGIATPTEAAAAGAFGTVVLSFVYRTLSLDVLSSATKSTVSITAMILFIVVSGSIFASVFFGTGAMLAVQDLVRELGLSPGVALAGILFAAFLGGFMLDLISLILILVPVAMPVIKMLGINEIWFCILLLVVLQTSYLSPPMAPSIFYLRAIAPPEIKLMDMYKGVLPFIALQVLTLLTVYFYPALALWLPSRIVGF